MPTQQFISNCNQLHGGSPYPRTLFVEPSGEGNYTKVKDACDYVTTQSPGLTSKWQILILPGNYVESPFTVPPYTTLVGLFSGREYGASSVSIQTDITSGTFITWDNGSGAINLEFTTESLTQAMTGDVKFFAFSSTGGVSFQSQFFNILAYPLYNGANTLYLLWPNDLTAVGEYRWNFCKLFPGNYGAGKGYVENSVGMAKSCNMFFSSCELSLIYTLSGFVISKATRTFYNCAVPNHAINFDLDNSAGGTLKSSFTNFASVNGTVTYQDAASTTIPGLVKKGDHVADADGTLVGVTAQFNALLDVLETAGVVSTS